MLEKVWRINSPPTLWGRRVQPLGKTVWNVLKKELKIGNHMILQSHSWAYIQRKQYFKKMHEPRWMAKEDVVCMLLLFRRPIVSDSCDPMDCSTPGLPVPHQLPEFAQVHVYCISDAAQPFHPLMPSFPLLSVFPSTRDFSNESSLHIRWPKYWSFSFSISPSSEYSGLISLKIDWFDFLAVQGTFRSLL